MLAERETYAGLKENDDNKIMKQIKHVPKQYQQGLAKKKIDYLQKFVPRTLNLYGLPQIHKS